MKANLIFSYLTQLYISAIGIVLMPLYLRYLGPEGLGLVGFYIMLQAWMPMLDFGLTPVLSREMSRFRAGAITAKEAAVRLRTLETVLGALASFAVVLLWVCGDWIGHSWLSAATLSAKTLQYCVVLIAIAVALRWFSGLQRAVLIGLEKHKLVNGLTAGFATFRFVGVLPLLLYVSSLPEHFFVFQAAAGALELSVFVVVTHHLVPGCKGVRPDCHVFASMMPMVGSMAFLSVMWVVMTQVDKLILSGLLPLKEYGYFALAVMAAGGVLVLVGPLNQIVQPRLTILAEKGAEDTLVELYRLISQFVVVAFVSLGGCLAFFAEPILLIWSGNAEVAIAAAPVLFWYGLANALIGILVPPFMLQFARGRLGLHVLGNLILLVTLVPALIFAAKYWKGEGAGLVFFVGNMLFLLFWVPIVHRYFLAALTWRWLLRDVLPAILVMVAVLFVGSRMLPGGMGVFATLTLIGVVAVVTAILGAMIGDLSRPRILRLFLGDSKCRFRA